MIRLNRIFEQDEMLPMRTDMESTEIEDTKEVDSDFDETYEEVFEPDLIEELVDLVGSEEDVEEAAEMCYNELMDAFQKNEIELDDDEVLPETLAFSALVVKLVELGKLDPSDAEDFLQEYFE
jgi:hypothetical protein